jgi:hypothetical protein
VLKLRDEWDAKIEAEKQAKIAAERARVEAIQGRIEAIRSAPLGAVGKSPAEILSARDAVRDTIIDDSFAEFKDRAMTVRSEAFNALEATHQQAVEAKAAALAAEEARKAEAARIEAERAELARLRAEQAERERLAKIESDRIAVEQAAEAKRLADLAAAQEAEARCAREAVEAELRAERERIAVEQAAAAADLKAAQDRLATEQAVYEARMQLERDHADALGMNVELNARREAERARLQALADQAAADARLPAPESVNVHDLPIDFGANEGPDDNEIIALVCEVYGMHRSAAIDRLAAIDFNAAREFQS